MTKRLIYGKRWFSEPGQDQVFSQPAMMLGDRGGLRRIALEATRTGAGFSSVIQAPHTKVNDLTAGYLYNMRATYGVNKSAGEHVLQRWQRIQHEATELFGGEDLDIWYQDDDYDVRYVVVGSPAAVGETLTEGTSGPVSLRVGVDPMYDLSREWMNGPPLLQFRETDRSVGGFNTATLIETGAAFNFSGATGFTSQIWFRSDGWASGEDHYIVHQDDQFVVLIDTSGILTVRLRFTTAGFTTHTFSEHFEPNTGDWYWLGVVFDSAAGTLKFYGSWSWETDITERTVSSSATPGIGDTLVASTERVRLGSKNTGVGGPVSNDDLSDAFEGNLGAFLMTESIYTEAELRADFQASRDGNGEFVWEVNTPTTGGAYALRREGRADRIANRFGGTSTDLEVDVSRHCSFPSSIVAGGTNPGARGLGDQLLIGPVDEFKNASEEQVDILPGRAQVLTIVHLVSVTEDTASRVDHRMSLGNGRTLFHAVSPGESIIKPVMRFPRARLDAVLPNLVTQQGAFAEANVDFNFTLSQIFFTDNLRRNYSGSFDVDPYA